MSDYSELKKLAEAAPEGPWFGPEYAPNTGYVFDNCLGSLLHYESIEYEQESCLLYVAAANPAVVLKLIADLERLERNNANQAESILKYQDQASGEDAHLDMLIADRNKLKAENEALRKDAERYRWLRDSSESVHQFYLSTPIWFTGVKFSKESVDSTIDAAMSKEQKAE